MARSALSPYHPKLAKKAFRAKAKQQGLTFGAAAEARAQELAAQKVPSAPGIVRRNPGRGDGVAWNGSAFICAQNVDGDVQTCIDDDDVAFDDCVSADLDLDVAYGNKALANRHIVISLLDIARPAKRKGAAKEFEVVDGVRRVIVLEDDDDDEEPFDEWEEIHEERDVVERDVVEPKSYSAALRGGHDR